MLRTILECISEEPANTTIALLKIPGLRFFRGLVEETCVIVVTFAFIIDNKYFRERSNTIKFYHKQK